jgi:SHS2 domain-containing protein
LTPRYRTIRHTADKAIFAWGRDLPELFENSAYGMFSLIADIRKLKPEMQREIKMKNDQEDYAILLADWLGELLYIFDAEKILFCQFKVESVDEKGVNSICGGVRVRPDLPWRGSYVKAITYHRLKIEKKGQLYRATLFFDV